MLLVHKMQQRFSFRNFIISFFMCNVYRFAFLLRVYDGGHTNTARGSMHSIKSVTKMFTKSLIPIIYHSVESLTSYEIIKKKNNAVGINELYGIFTPGFICVSNTVCIWCAFFLFYFDVFFFNFFRCNVAIMQNVASMLKCFVS